MTFTPSRPLTSLSSPEHQMREAIQTFEAQLSRLLTRSEVARLLAVDVSTLSRWSKQGIGPRCIRLEGHTVRYAAADVAAYLEANKSA